MSNEGFNLVYVKSGNSPKNKYFHTRKEIIRFILLYLDNMDLIFINDMVLNKEELVNNNLKLARYLKLKKIKDIYDI
jgi:hypothetical protein